MTNDFIEAGKRVRIAAEKLKSMDLEIERLETLKAERSAQEAELEAAQAVLLDAAETFEAAPVVSLEQVSHEGSVLRVSDEAIEADIAKLDAVIDPGLETETTAPDLEGGFADEVYAAAADALEASIEAVSELAEAETTGPDPEDADETELFRERPEGNAGDVLSVTVTDVVTGEVETISIPAGVNTQVTEAAGQPEAVVDALEARKADIDQRNAEIQKLREEREQRDAANIPANAPSPEAEMAGVMMQEASERLAETAEQVGEAKTIIDATDDILPEPTQEEIDAVLNDDTPFPGMGGGLARSQPD